MDNTNKPTGFVMPKERMGFSTQVAYLTAILLSPIAVLSVTLISNIQAAVTATAYVALQLLVAFINQNRGFNFLNGIHRYILVLLNYFLLMMLSFELGAKSSLNLFYFVNIAASFVYLRVEERFMLYSSLALGLVAILLDFYLDLNPFINAQPELQDQQIYSYFAITGFLIFFFVYLFFMVSMMDRVEKSNKNKTSNLQAVVKTNDSVIYEVDKEYGIRNVWASERANIPLSNEQLKNGVDIFQLFEDALSDKIRDAVDQVLTTNTALELQHLMESDGNWYEYRLRPFNRDGSETRVSMTSHNINHIKKIEANIDKYDAAQSDILMLLSSVIRTPLNTINSFIERLLADNPSEKQITRLKIIKNSSDNVLGLINGMIDFYNIDKGTFEMEKNEFDLFQKMHDLEDAFLPEAVKNRVILRVDVDRAIPDKLIGAEEKIDQVLSNLIQNALKYTEVGKISVTAQMVKRQGKKVFVVFRVKDTGAGIPMEKQHLFNNFDRIDLGTIRQFGDTGISLAVSKLIVSTMGSNLELHSEEGKGSRFSFILPLLLKDLPSEEEEALSLVDNGELEGKSVIIADYDTDQLAEISSICESWGMEVVTAGDGSSVLKKLISRNYDVLLTSLSLPGMDGYETTSRIRASKKEKKRVMPIVALTDDSSRHLFKKVRLAGMNGFVRKPVNNKDLREALIALLVNKKAMINPEETYDDEGYLVSDNRPPGLNF